MMRISDFVGRGGTITFVLVALVIFLTVFAGVLLYLWVLKKEDVERYASLPLENTALPGKATEPENTFDDEDVTTQA